MTATDWHQLIIPSGSLLVLVVRGTLIYLALFIMLRVVLKRRAAGVSMPDVLLVVLIADAAQNGMANDYKSVTEGLVLVATILFWGYALDWLEFHVPSLAKVIEPAPLLLVENGRLLRRNLREELMTLQEFESLLREQGVEEIGNVRRAHLEPTGRLSVLKFDKGQTS